MAALLLLAGCQPDNRQTLTIEALGGAELTVIARDAASTREAITTVQEELQRMDEYAGHPKRSPVQRTNKLLATGEWFSANPSVLPLLGRARELSLQSDHLYNPALGQLRELWNINSAAPRPPSIRHIAEALKEAPTMAAVEIDGIRVRSRNRAVRVDFDQLVQGFAVDRELALLQARGIRHAQLRVGPVTGVLGNDGPGDWRLALPGSFTKRGLPGALALADGERACLLTPEEGFSYQQHQYHRHLDARTGWPAAGIDSVIVIHARGDTAAVACAALLVAGPRDWPAVAARLGVREVLLQTGTGQLEATAALRTRLPAAAAITVRTLP